MRFGIILCLLLIYTALFGVVKSQCTQLQTCAALGSYYIWPGAMLSFIAQNFSTYTNNILSYNPQITDPNLIRAGTRLVVPFSCDCINNQFRAHRFSYRFSPGETYQLIAQRYFSNLTTVDMLSRFNSYPPDNIPEGARLNVTVNCSCGNSQVSRDYGLFMTYPLRPGQNLDRIATLVGLPASLLQAYNPGVDFSNGSGLVFIPGRDQNGTYPPLGASNSSGPSGTSPPQRSSDPDQTSPPPSASPSDPNGTSRPPRSSPTDPNGASPPLKSRPSGLSGGAITGISVAAVLGAASFSVCLYVAYKMITQSEEPQPDHNNKIEGITMDKSVKYTHKELYDATDGFSSSHKIGQGGYASVFYGELRGKKAAIKKMDVQATKEFLAELNVLTHIHHVNLVRLIGYCIEGSLFLVYEYIDNGNLSKHLAQTGVTPLPWSTRVQIALDSARGLEYIHEHTVPVYIHRDVKSDNILIDKNFRAKVADFGLAKLTEVGCDPSQTRLVGTRGYMPFEYVQYGDLSHKTDVYAFGVVLYQLISSKKAIIKTNESTQESIGLVGLFEEAFEQDQGQMESLRTLVDPSLGNDFPFDQVSKVARLAKACTHFNPQFRPSMRSIVVELMTLSPLTEDWNIGRFENQILDNINQDSSSWIYDST